MTDFYMSMWEVMLYVCCSDVCCGGVRLELCFFFFKQKTAYEMRISDWSADVCSSDLYFSQSVAEHFAVITVCKIDDLEASRDLLFSASLGKVLPTYVQEIQYLRGATFGLDASVIWWRDILITHRDRCQ